MFAGRLATILVLVTFTSTANLALPTADAAPGSSVANGRRCSSIQVAEPVTDSENKIDQVNAGPLAAADAGASIQITCTIQVGGANSTHAGVNAGSVTSTVSTQVASIPPTEDDQPPLINYVSPDNVPVFLCTEAIINGTSWYWDATVATEGPVDQLDTARGWTTNPGALCNEAISQEIWPGPVGDALCTILPGQSGDPTGAIYIGPDGDLYIMAIWILDCAPEDNPVPGPLFPDSLGLLGCDDGLDNDLDGTTDSTDPGCAGPTDTSERGTTMDCDDGADDDGDRLADYPADGGCESPWDPDETGSAACADGFDNDGDGSRDYPADPGCSGPADPNERGSLPCDDGVDNDNDGTADYPGDGGCHSPADPNETTIP